MTITDRQPDDPGPSFGVCPECGCRCRRDPDHVARRLLRANAGRVDKSIIAMALNWSLDRLERFAAREKFDLRVRDREHEPRGA